MESFLAVFLKGKNFDDRKKRPHVKKKNPRMVDKVQPNICDELSYIPVCPKFVRYGMHIIMCVRYMKENSEHILVLS